MDRDLARRATAEFVGTAFLVAIVVGSGIYAQRLSPANVGLQLLENSIATGAGLVALILALGPVSGAHFNPIVTMADRILGGTSSRDAGVYVVVQISRRVRRRDGRQPHVRPARDRHLHPHAFEQRAVARRSGRRLRAAARDPRRRARRSRVGGRVRGRRVHRCRLLVHVVDQLRQPRGHRSVACSATRLPASRRAACPCSS